MTTTHFNSSHWRVSSQWFVLNRAHAMLAVEDLHVKEVFRRFCHTTRWRVCVSDEHYLASLLASYGLEDQTDCLVSKHNALCWDNIRHLVRIWPGPTDELFHMTMISICLEGLPPVQMHVAACCTIVRMRQWIGSSTAWSAFAMHGNYQTGHTFQSGQGTLRGLEQGKRDSSNNFHSNTNHSTVCAADEGRYKQLPKYMPSFVQRPDQAVNCNRLNV